MLFKTIVLLFALFAVQGSLFNLLPTTITNTARGLTQDLTKIPVAQNAVPKSGEAVVRPLQIFSLLSSVARSLPSLVRSTNLNGITAKFEADFHAGAENEDTKLSIENLITKYGFPVEKHEVVTDDGYVLALFRIPGNGRPVFLMHGLLSSADDFVLNGPDNGLAYLLAKEGYDIWLGNARGNKHSRRHLHLSPKRGKFWDFSWHEIGFYDLPAMIDYTLNKTGEHQVKYIGHSQGTTAFFVMASTRPEYNDKIELMIALSPIAFMEHLKSPLVRVLAPVTDLVEILSKSLGIYEILPDNLVTRALTVMVCGRGALVELLCGNLVFLVTGFSAAQLNATSLPVILGHIPSGGSVKQFLHYGQSVSSGNFRKFDYGVRGNIKRYGSKVPPKYPLKKITAPVYLFYSDEDWLANSADVEKLYDRLGNVVGVYPVPYHPFNHFDFIFAKDFKSLIYTKLRKILSV